MSPIYTASRNRHHCLALSSLTLLRGATVSAVSRTSPNLPKTVVKRPNSGSRHCQQSSLQKPTTACPSPPLGPITSPRHDDLLRRASNNTFRCLIGCTIGDFSTLFYLQANFPNLAPAIVMGASMTAGIITSVMLETVLLKHWEAMPFQRAFKTAVGMSMISMVAMETVETAVDWHLTGGMIDFGDPWFWMSGGTAMLAGFLAALPYNYWRLRKFGKACH